MEASELEDVEVGKVAQRHPSMHHAPGHLLAASLQLLDAHLQLLSSLSANRQCLTILMFIYVL